MTTNTYNPQPKDTTHIVLSESMLNLREELAENVHDEWAYGRIKDGWTWGAVRDDNKKHHPCLVPYSELPESEKQYDRTTAESTLKYMISKGYQWTKQSDDKEVASGHGCRETT